MKLKFQGMAATAEPDINGERFSIQALEAMREQAIGKNISVSFLHVLEGEIERAILTDGNELIVKGWMELDRSPLGISWGIHIVPGYTVGEDKEFEDIVEFGLTYNPADEHLTPIKFWEFGG